MGEISAGSQMGKIRNFEKGFMATHLIGLGDKLGLFEALNESEEGLSVAELASKLGLNEQYLKFWCLTAYHFEILDGDDRGRFKLQPFLNEILGDKTHFRNYLANIALDVDYIGPGLMDAPEYYRTGKQNEFYNAAEMSLAAYEATKNIPLIWHAMIFPKNEQLKQMLEQGVKFLDIGCGNGNLITQLAPAFPNSQFSGVNPDIYGIEVAKNKISQLGLDERVFVDNIGGHEISYKDEFDMISMVMTLHEILPNVRPQAMENAYQALKSEGWLLILDFPPYPTKLEDLRDPMYEFAIFDQFFEAFGGFIHLTLDKQNELLANVGFKDVQRTTIGRGMFEFLTARK